jgi:hypothetical protein
MASGWRRVAGRVRRVDPVEKRGGLFRGGLGVGCHLRWHTVRHILLCHVRYTFTRNIGFIEDYRFKD